MYLYINQYPPHPPLLKCYNMKLITFSIYGGMTSLKCSCDVRVAGACTLDTEHRYLATTHTHTHKHTYVRMHTYTLAPTHTHAHLHTRKCKHRLTQTRTHTYVVMLVPPLPWSDLGRGRTDYARRV